MSKCISRHGEYSEHTVGEGDSEFTCQWCWSFDEDAALAVIKDLRAALAAVSAGPEPAKRFSEDDLQGLRDDLYTEVGQATGYISDHDDDTVDWKTQFTDTLMFHFERFLRDFAGAGPEPEYEYGRQYTDEGGSPHLYPAREYGGDTTSPDGHRADGSPYWNYTRMRRRKAGPWEVVDGE